MPPCRVECLKYLVLASMLMESHVDPFNAQETQPYREDPQIKAMTSLVEAYQNDKLLKRFEKNRELAAGVWQIWFQRKLADGYLEDVKKGLVSGIAVIWK